MFDDEATYFRHRAEVETERARMATAPEVVAVHYQLAEAYFARLAQVDQVAAKAA